MYVPTDRSYWLHIIEDIIVYCVDIAAASWDFWDFWDAWDLWDAWDFWLHCSF